ncbi:MAG: hypothetical protein ABEJ78_10735 [Haloferacaceae archaeon]
MTDRIDIDDLDVDDGTEETPNRGDWFWSGEGDPDEESGWLSTEKNGDAADGGTDATSSDAGVDADVGGGIGTDADATESADSSPTTPRVPLTDDEAPVGIPVHSGGAGAGEAGSGDEPAAVEAEPTTDGDSAPDDVPTAGGTAHESHADPDEMTTAFTYEAVRRLANPRRAVNEARGWSDWVGVVGDVEAHVLNKFQREHRLDLDFFNGTGTGPAERLAAVDGHSMFYAERMVVVGTDGESWIATEADWEFVPLAEAAREANWSLTDA